MVSKVAKEANLGKISEGVRYMYRGVPVKPQKYSKIFIIKFIIYSGYNWANLDIFLGIVR